MKRRVLSLLLALCLIVGLLPAVTVQHAHAADTVLTEQIKMNGKTLTAKTDGTCGYLVNGTTGLTNTNASADNWNVKFEYPVNGTPTLTLKGVKQTSGSGIAGVKNGDVTALNIVIAEDCDIVTSGALLDNSGPYIGDITITSIGDATLTANSTKGITSKKNLVLNANLTIEVPRYNGGNTQHINTNEAGNITFDGGKYVLTSSSVPGNGTWEGPSNGVIFAQGTGNVVINDGDFTLRSSYSSSTNSGMIRVASGTITINGGRINMQTGYINAFLAKNGTTINGGDIYAESYGNYIVGNASSAIKMTGGSLQMKGAGGTGNSTIYSNAQIDLTEYTGCVIKNGTTAESAKVINELKTNNGVVGYVSITPCEHVWGDPVETTVS